MLTQINLPDELHKALKVYLAQNEITNMPSGIIKILGERLLPQIDDAKDVEIIQRKGRVMDYGKRLLYEM